MIGENRKGLAEIEPFEEQDVSGRPQWIVQSAAVMVADILSVAGETGRACRVAVAGFNATGLEPLGHGYTGTVARWLGRTAASTCREDVALSVIDRLCDDLEDYDLLDQAEILCARDSLGRITGSARSNSRELLSEKLSRLPPPVEEQLRRLGALG
jgi:hypothetical protein